MKYLRIEVNRTHVGWEAVLYSYRVLVLFIYLICISLLELLEYSRLYNIRESQNTRPLSLNGKLLSVRLNEV